MDHLEESNKENKRVHENGGSPPRVKRPNLSNIMSRSYQIEHGAALSNSRIKGVSCDLICVSNIDSSSGMSEKGFKYKIGKFKGIPSHLDPNNKSDTISIPFDHQGSKKTDSAILTQLGYIRAHYPEELFDEFPPIVVSMASIIEVSTFNNYPEDVQPGDVVGISDLIATMSFVKSSKQEGDRNGDELGRIRPVNTPYINFKGTVYFKRRLNSTEFKNMVARLPLKADMTVNNKFIGEDGQLVFPEDICYPNPSTIDPTPIPMFTRLTPNDLLDIGAALYNPRASGFGLIRNRCVIYDEIPQDELEPENGLPMFITSIPQITEEDARDITFEVNKVKMKCLRGPEPLKLMTAAQYPESKEGLFRVGQPLLFTTLGLYESRPKSMEDIPQYVSGIGILSVMAWEKYITPIMRGLEALLFIKPSEAQSLELSLKDLPKNNGCTHGVKGTTVVIPNMYKTLMGSALRVKASVAIDILLKEQVQRAGKRIGDAGMLKDRYGIKDRLCEQFVVNKNSVKHFFVNAYDGYIDDLPKDDNEEWDYFLIPAEGTIEMYKVRKDIRTNKDVIREQKFWFRNNDEDWVEKNKELTNEWCSIPQVMENIGVFCAKRDV